MALLLTGPSVSSAEKLWSVVVSGSLFFSVLFSLPFLPGSVPTMWYHGACLGILGLHTPV